MSSSILSIEGLLTCSPDKSMVPLKNDQAKTVLVARPGQQDQKATLHYANKDRKEERL